MKRSFDIAVFGSGFAGSLMAMIARSMGFSVVLIERGKHPRVTIGESSTPLANLLIEELAKQYRLPGIAPLAKWGSWQRTYPEVGCGLKRGFTFYHHELGRATVPNSDREDQLLVAASPHDMIADTHWYRADFDSMLVQQAQALGVEYIDEAAVERFADGANGVSFEVVKSGVASEFLAAFAIDATGPRGLLYRLLNLAEEALPGYPATEALYSHFSGVKRPVETHGISEAPPYPAEDAAVHHVFDGGWIWVLRFNNGMTSAGVAATREASLRLSLREGEQAWLQLVKSIPTLREQFASAQAETAFTYLPRIAYLTSRVHGQRWAMLSSAAGFIDPLLSTGFPLTLLGIGRLAQILEGDWTSNQFASALQQYQRQTKQELLATARLIAALYANMANFNVFKAITLLYFTAATYSETTRRLAKPHLAQSFLLHDHPSFGPQCGALLDRAMHLESQKESATFCSDVLKTIEPLDVAGLSRQDRRNWYPVDAEDLLSSASKVDAKREEIEDLLERSGFYPAGQTSP